MDLSKHALFAYGGNGGLFACGVAERAGLGSVYLFHLGPVFSAFGSSVSDISHVYERPLFLQTLDESTLERIRTSVEEMKAEGTKDLLGEGLEPTDVSYLVEVEVSKLGQPGVCMPMPELALQSLNAATFQINAAMHTSTTAQRENFSIDLVRLQIRKAIPKPRLSTMSATKPDAAHALKGTRRVSIGSTTGWAQIYTWESLQPGNRIEGCAVLEGANSTYFVPEGWTLEMDRYGNAKLSRR